MATSRAGGKGVRPRVSLALQGLYPPIGGPFGDPGGAGSSLLNCPTPPLDPAGQSGYKEKQVASSRGSHRQLRFRLMTIRKLCATLAVCIVLGFCLPGIKAQKKELSKEDIIELLTGDVAPERVAAIVRERGVSFTLSHEAEDQIRQAGGNDELLNAIRALEPKPSGSSSNNAKPPAAGPHAGPPILLIEAMPGGARVYVDDEPVGTTSPEGRLKLVTLSPGAHRVRLAHRDFQDHEEMVQLSSGETTRVATNLVSTAATPAAAVSPVTNSATASSGGPAYLGIRPAIQQPANRKGVVISAVDPGGPADRAGLKPNNTIVSIGGREVRTPQDLESAIASHKVGETVEVVWSSFGHVTVKSIQFSTRPSGVPSHIAP